MSKYDTKELHEKVHGLEAELKAMEDTLSEKKPSFTEEELAIAEEKLSQKREWEAQIKTAEVVGKFTASENAIVVGKFTASENAISKPTILREEKLSEKECEEGFKAWAMYQRGAGDLISEAQKNAVAKAGINLAQKTFSGQFDAWTSPVTGYNYTIQDQVVNEITVARRKKSQLRQACRALPTTDGRPLPLPYVDDTSNAASKVDRFGGGYSNTNITIPEPYKLQAWKNTTATLKVPFAYFSDSVIPVRPLITQLLGSRLQGAEDEMLTNGGGTTTCKGLANWVGATLFYPNPENAEVNWWDVLVRTKMSVGIQYIDSSSAYMVGADTWTEILASEDGLGRPLYTPSVNEMGIQKLFGDLVYINPYLTNGEVFYGNFANYAVVRSLPVRFYTLNEVYVEEFDSIGFCAASEVDFGLLDTKAFAKAEVGSGSFINCGTFPAAAS